MCNMAYAGEAPMSIFKDCAALSFVAFPAISRKKRNGWGTQDFIEQWVGGADCRMLQNGLLNLLFFEDGSAFLVGEDGAFETTEIGGLFGGNLNLTDNEFALVMEVVVFGRDR